VLKIFSFAQKLKVRLIMWCI